METFNHLENKIPSNNSNQGSQYFRTTNGILSASDNLSAIKSSHTTLPNILGIIEITSNFRLFQKGKQRETGRVRERQRETERATRVAKFLVARSEFCKLYQMRIADLLLLRALFRVYLNS